MAEHAEPVAAAAGGWRACVPSVEAIAGGFRSVVHARIGLLGNPSDGYGGKCLSLSLDDYAAEVRRRSAVAAAAAACSPSPTQELTTFIFRLQVTLTPADSVEFALAGAAPSAAFPDLAALAADVGAFADAADGGVRLLAAAARRFAVRLADGDGALPASARGFRLAYATDIPRQRGLSGSSAIVIGALNCLGAYFGAGTLSVAERPALALAAEQDLGIDAGLQDRVVQVYGGLVSMDFFVDPPWYESLDPAALPPLWLIYPEQAAPGAPSGAAHGEFRRRWDAGDAALRAQMCAVAALAARGRELLLPGAGAQQGALAPLMDENFTLRRSMFGDTAVGAESLRMAEVARGAGAAAKLTGSGGAVVAAARGDDFREARLAAACAAAGLRCERVRVAPARHIAPAY
jgi:glucuronokinase